MVALCDAEGVHTSLSGPQLTCLHGFLATEELVQQQQGLPEHQVSLGQVRGLAPEEPRRINSAASPSGFTIPIQGSEDSISTLRSSLSTRRLSNVTGDRHSASMDASYEHSNGSSKSANAAQMAPALAAQAANLHALDLLSSSETRRRSGVEQPDASRVTQRSSEAAAQLLSHRPQPHVDVDAAPHDPPAALPLSSLTGEDADRLRSAFGMGDEQSQGPVPPSEVKSIDAAAMGGPAFVSPFSSQQMSSAEEDSPRGAPMEVPAIRGGSLTALEPGSDDMCRSRSGLQSKLSKVDEVQSSMERSSSDLDPAAPVLATDSQGREAKSNVLEGIHEQERAQRISEESQRLHASASSSGASSSGSVGRWRGRGNTTPGIHPDFLRVGAAAEQDAAAGQQPLLAEQDIEPSLSNPALADGKAPALNHGGEQEQSIANSSVAASSEHDTPGAQQQDTGMTKSSRVHGMRGSFAPPQASSQEPAPEESAGKMRDVSNGGTSLQRLWSFGKRAFGRMGRSPAAPHVGGPGPDPIVHQPPAASGWGASASAPAPVSAAAADGAPRKGAAALKAPRKSWGRRAAAWVPHGTMQATRKSLLGESKGHRRSHTADNALLE
jgi:hypothetical protein